jgi:hypothetical protein
MFAHPPGPAIRTPQPFQSEQIQMTKSKPNKPYDFEAIRNGLPFFKKGHRMVQASWWNVTPSGDYAADLKTGR